MRIYEEAIDVRQGPVPTGTDEPIEGPAQFVWRNRLWKVSRVQNRWVTTASWWDAPAAQAVRDGSVQPADTVDDDLLAEEEVWRVEASRGPFEPGIYELTHTAHGSWRLSRAVD